MLRWRGNYDDRRSTAPDRIFKIGPPNCLEQEKFLMVQAALKNPYLVIAIALAIMVLGGYSYTKIPADLLPQFDTPAVQIVCFYPGMPPEVMEKDIMSRLQRWTGQSVGIAHQEAKAMQSVCIVKDFFREGISSCTRLTISRQASARYDPLVLLSFND